MNRDDKKEIMGFPSIRASSVEDTVLLDERPNRGFDSNISCDIESMDQRDSQEPTISGESHKMRRVDWRWAAAKGFLNRDTNQWNEDLGGKEAYIRQRNERISARFMKIQFAA
jgi:hypothetical protein